MLPEAVAGRVDLDEFVVALNDENPEVGLPAVGVDGDEGMTVTPVYPDAVALAEREMRWVGLGTGLDFGYGF